MSFTRDHASGAGAGWRKCAVLLLALAAVGLPVDHVGLYALLLVVAVVVFTGEVSARPRSWLAAVVIVAVARELVALHFGAAHIVRGVMQMAHWLSGPAQSYATIPMNAAGFAVLVYVVASRRFDPWLRLISGSALAQHAVALFYVSTTRYHFLTWFLTALIVVVWLHEVGIGWLQQRYPEVCSRLAAQPAARRLASGLAHLQELSA